MALQLIESELKVIGFNAVFNSVSGAQTLCDIDQVEACLYRGEPLQQNESHFNLLQSAQDCANLILEANHLAMNQIALIVINNGEDVNPLFIESFNYYRIDFVKHLSDALILSQQLVNDYLPILIISVSDNPVFDSSVVDNKLSEKATISFDKDFDGYASHQGVACLLLSSPNFVIENNSVVYASIDKICIGSHAQIDQVINAALMDIDRHLVNTLEVSACSNVELNLLEQNALLKAYSGKEKLSTSISCHKSVFGENTCLSEVMGLIHCVIALQQRYRPSIQNWSSPTQSLLKQWQNSDFYVFNQATPRFPDPSGKAQLNTVSIVTADDVSHLVLSEVNDGVIHPNGFNRCAKQSLFIVGADDEHALLEKIHFLIEKIRLIIEKNAINNALKILAQTLYEDHQKSDFSYKVVLIADSIEALNKELSLSLTGIKSAFLNVRNDQRYWKTPKGSYFTSQPQKHAKTAFLYPGIGATYIGLGRDLFHLFPEVYPSVLKLADDIGASLKDDLLNPRSVVSLDFTALKQRELALRYNLANIAECGVGYGCVFTKIFEQVFKLNADFASGYSMGEISMFAALGCWQKPKLMSALLANSDTFNHQLSGELRAIRRLWNLPDVKNGEFEAIWETYSIKGSLEGVQAAIGEGERVYITIINTPDSLVIGGLPEDCLKVIERLDVRAMPLNMANAIHSEPAYQEYQRMLSLFSMPVTERIKTKMISSSCYLPIPQLEKAIAVSIAKCLCEPVDFPRLIKTLAQKQTQVFIEMGAGRSLSSWTDKILKTHVSPNHISVPVNAKGTDDQLTYARAIAKLVSFGLDIDIDSFFKGSLIQFVVQK